MKKDNWFDSHLEIMIIDNKKTKKQKKELAKKLKKNIIKKLDLELNKDH